LALVVIGCLLLYPFGLSAPVDPTGAINLIAEQPDKAEIAKGKRYLILGRIGIALVAFGTVFQLWATWAA
jgi:hypothetical protein